MDETWALLTKKDHIVVVVELLAIPSQQFHKTLTDITALIFFECFQIGCDHDEKIVGSYAACEIGVESSDWKDVFEKKH